MATRHFEKREDAEVFANTLPGAYVAKDPVGFGWIVIWP